MYKVLHASVRQFATCKCLRQLSVLRLPLQNGIKWNGSSPLSLHDGSVSRGKFHRRSKHCHISDKVGTSTCRFYSAERGSRKSTQEQDRGKTTSQMYTSIEPEREEEFVFLDYDEPENLNEDKLLEQFRVTDTVISKGEKMPRRSDTEMQQANLELQLRSLNDMTKGEVDQDSVIEFHDLGFPLEEDSTKKKKAKKQQKIYGTPDTEIPVSNTCCSGCGALMHCTDPDVAGYLPSEKYKSLIEEDKLKRAICQRCFLLTHHQKALNVTMSKEEYRDIVRTVKPQKALVLLIVDLLDIPDSIIPDLPELIGKNKHIVILGNKVDLLPRDSDNYLQRIKRQLSQYCTNVGITTSDLKEIHLISAKTGYGIENLITSLQMSWKYKGDVYLVGTANAGKSTLFNTLLESDYCKSKASDVIHKATISPWPGTTLNLLKFPIINPTPYRMFKRAERLKQAALQTEEDLSPQQLKRIRQFSKQGYLVGHIGRTFRADPSPSSGLVEFDPDSLSFGEDMEVGIGGKLASEPSPEVELTYNELKDAHWFYDTPGIMKERDILSMLTEEEVKLVVPTHAIAPRTFVLKPGMVLFVGAMARIDYLEGNHSCWFSVIASSRVPVHITSLDKADAIYQKHAGNTLLGVPTGGEERMKDFLPLISQDFELQGQGYTTAVTDIKLSSAGWVAVTGVEGERLLLRAHAPEAAGLCLRNPPLLPHIASLKGERIRKTPAYKTKKPQTVVDTKLTAQGAERLKVKRKK